jgi:lipoate-protein ligase A
MHDALIGVLHAQGVRAERFQASGAKSDGEEPFLCFRRRTDGDVVVDQVKILGSAQRRRQAALLQHGSLLLRASRGAPELPGLAELTGRSWAAEEVLEMWLAGVLQAGGWTPQRSELDEQEIRLAEFWEQSRFARTAWNEKR